MKFPKLLLLISLVIMLSEIVVVLAHEEEDESGGGETAEASTATETETTASSEENEEELPEAATTTTEEGSESSSEETQATTTEQEANEGGSSTAKKQTRQKLDLTRKSFNGPQLNAEGKVEINCDHKCGAKLRVETMELNRIKNLLGKKLIGRSFHAQAVTEQSEKYTEWHERAKQVQAEEKSKADAAMEELKSSQQIESTTKINLEKCQTTSQSTIRMLEADLKTLEAEIDYYEGLRFLVNVDNIKSDIKEFLKKYSLVKN